MFHSWWQIGIWVVPILHIVFFKGTITNQAEMTRKEFKPQGSGDATLVAWQNSDVLNLLEKHSHHLMRTQVQQRSYIFANRLCLTCWNNSKEKPTNWPCLHVVIFLPRQVGYNAIARPTTVTSHRRHRLQFGKIMVPLRLLDNLWVRNVVSNLSNSFPQRSPVCKR